MTDGLNQFAHILGELVGTVNNFLWTYILIAALILLGLWFTYKTKFVQIRCIPEMFRLIGEGVGSLPREGHISTFQAFCVSTASRVGVMVPFMAGAYLMVAIFFTCMHIDQYPRVLYEIVTNAFDFDAAYGATFGMIVMTGIKRGLFSNEAGMGAVPNAAAAADATHPVKQGLVQALGVYFDTMVVCTASAMIVLIVPGWKESGRR